jgi:hypothetical protein
MNAELICHIRQEEVYRLVGISVKHGIDLTHSICRDLMTEILDDDITLDEIVGLMTDLDDLEKHCLTAGANESKEAADINVRMARTDDYNLPVFEGELELQTLATSPDLSKIMQALNNFININRKKYPYAETLPPDAIAALELSVKTPVPRALGDGCVIG